MCIAIRATQFDVSTERNFIAPVMNLSQAFILLLLPLKEQCLAFYPVCLCPPAMLMSNLRSNVLEAVQVA